MAPGRCTVDALPVDTLHSPLLAEYDGGAHFAAELAAGNSPRAVLSAVPNRPGHWPALLLEAALAANESGRGALIVVPDARDLTRLCTLLDERIGAGNYVRLSAEDGQTPRYRSFLRVARGNANLVVGTRNAAFAPVKDLGLVDHLGRRGHLARRTARPLPPRPRGAVAAQRDRERRHAGRGARAQRGGPAPDPQQLGR